MESGNNTSLFLDKVIVRVAPLPFESTIKEDTFFQQLCENPVFMRALFHAHPLVHRKAGDWINGLLKDNQKIQKLKDTLYNYYTRMYSNTVPYGFFSSVGMGQWSNGGSDIKVSGFMPYVRLDMEVLGALVNYINANDAVKRLVKYYPNNSIYQAGIQYRYIETTFPNNKINYRISAVDHSEFLASVFEAAKKGTTIQQLAEQFAGEYSIEELSGFFYELAEAQLLVPETQLNITGPDPFTRLRELIQALQQPGEQAIDELVAFLDQVYYLLQQLNQPDADIIGIHGELSGLFTQAGLRLDERHLLQVDNFSAFSTHHLSNKIRDSLFEAVKALSCFNQKNYKPFLESFKTKFAEKYEDAWVPLMQALDTESGVSFGYFSFIDDSVLTADIDFTKKQQEYMSRTSEGDKVRQILYKRYFEACQKNEYTVKLSKEDFRDLKDKVDQLAASYQVVFNVVNKEDNLLVLRTAGNSSGGNLLSRFTYASEEMTDLLKEIAKREQQNYKDCMLAEIVHLPDHRIGNITFRPVFRDYEIPVLTQSVLPVDAQVALSDLMISVRDGKIVLWSKKLNKRIVPMLTNAHNYGMNTTPVYQFLSELVYQDMLPSLFMDRGELSYMSVFNRRVQYENVIIYPATWNFEKEELKELLDHANDLDSTIIEAFRKKWNLPERTTFSDNASSILIQWNSVLSVQHFLKTIQKKTVTIFLEEYLYDENSPMVRDEQGRGYQSEYIAVVDNKAKQDHAYIPNYSEGSEVKKKFFPGEEWVYFKIYSGIRTSNKILANELQEALSGMYADGLISKFFFIRYNDPEYHLRLRFLSPSGNVKTVIERIQQALSYYTANNFIWKMQIDTYMREIDRYGETTMDFSESVFDIDSNYFIEVLPQLSEDYGGLAPLFFVKGIDSLLTAFGYDLDSKYRLLEQKKRSYESEFGVNENINLKLAVDKKEKDLRKPVEDFMQKGADDSRFTSFYEAIYKREIALQQLTEQNRHLLSPETIASLINSFVHMHAIRMFQANPRANELVGYYILYFYYHKCVRLKQKIAV